MKQKLGTVIAVIASVILIAVIAYDASLKSEQLTFFAMNTVVSAEVNGGEDNCISEIEKAVTDLDALISRHNEKSTVSLINRNREGTVDNRVADYFSLLYDVSRKSGGAFDFTLGALSDLWGFGKKNAVPDGAEIQKLLSESGYEKVLFSGNTVSIGGGMLDLGAAGKGMALNEARGILEKSEAKNAVISVGGSVLIYGKKEVKVGIRDPYGNVGRSVVTLKVSDSCVSTSGSYERYFEENGKIYHHILDPKTGYPVENNLISVTIISKNGALTDALSTACFVLGLDEGIKLAKEYGCEAVFITNDKKIYATGGIYSETNITDNSYILVKYEN